MKFLTDEKLVIVGAAGMIGSNMAQTAMMLGLVFVETAIIYALIVAILIIFVL